MPVPATLRPIMAIRLFCGFVIAVAVTIPAANQTHPASPALI